MKTATIDPMKEYVKSLDKKFKGSRFDCPALRMALWMPDSGFPRPEIDILNVGEKGNCQCRHCEKIMRMLDRVMIKALCMPNKKRRKEKR